ncbi:MAG TPA: tRNA (adenosine(37)-N6)-dimethylallyltransferase MiaA [Ornithinimicrobium sp.]|uniref:tRNA (adenosine(37)-N6)-dimethylallyltransferase MiaA n=1 Tax=Ornithinimicrobium sp. TaxID=1977084 RepID=UPI002B48D034|nr:tRNA (adenosine(37)-N6)-dimethylallyltransferase MiaA [Ornithinimicrobium sp.]HKJ12577.1 tRNA (adenosine(37)-N6)-dimethylallyltransferase MiaA [Ornithinimicrobium sp.]
MGHPADAPVVAVVGATATGKSDLGLALARALGGEVVGADASQLYCGMDIGTAKLPAHRRQDVAHHQIDVLEVWQEARVAAYQQHARADMARIRARGARPVVVGGSGLYVRALLDRLDIPPTDPGVRARWEERLAREGAQSLHDLLADRDPAAARGIDWRNGRRLVRALEVIDLTGRPFSATMPTREFAAPTVMIGLGADRPTLDERITRRVRDMWDAGMLHEVSGLVDQGLRPSSTAVRAAGYPQALAQLDGRLSEEQAQSDTVVATRRLARRQISWFGADPRVVWLPHDAPDLVERALALAG